MRREYKARSLRLASGDLSYARLRLGPLASRTALYALLNRAYAARSISVEAVRSVQCLRRPSVDLEPAGAARRRFLQLFGQGGACHGREGVVGTCLAYLALLQHRGVQVVCQEGKRPRPATLACGLAPWPFLLANLVKRASDHMQPDLAVSGCIVAAPSWHKVRCNNALQMRA